MTVFAKNKAGLKELFELITLSHTTYLAYNGKSTENVVAEPRIPREELLKKGKTAICCSALHVRTGKCSKWPIRAIMKFSKRRWNFTIMSRCSRLNATGT